MADGLSPEKLDALLKQGAINQSTYDKGMNAFGVQPQPEPNATPMPESQMSAASSGSEASASPAPAMTAEPAAVSGQPSPGQPQMPQPEMAQPGELPGDRDLSAAPRQMSGAERMDQSLTEAEKALAKEAQAGASQAAAEAGYYEEAAKQAKRFDNEAKVAEADRQRRWEDGIAKRQQIEDELANTPIDSNRYWKNMGTGQKIASLFSIALGAWGSAFNKTGENAALKSIQTEIDRDINAQKASIAGKERALDRQSGLLAEMRGQFKDERLAEAHTRMAYTNMAENKLREIAARYKSPVVEANLQKAVAAIEQERAKLQMQIEDAHKTAEARQMLGGSSTAEAQALARIPEEERTRFVQGDGFKGFAPTKERALKLNEMATETKNQVGMIDDLVKLGKEEGRQWGPTEAAAQAEVLRNVLKGQLRTAIVGPGAMTESELKLLDSIVDNPTAVRQINAQKKLEKLKMVLQRNLLNKAKSEGMNVMSLSEGAPVR